MRRSKDAQAVWRKTMSRIVRRPPSLNGHDHEAPSRSLAAIGECDQCGRAHWHPLRSSTCVSCELREQEGW